MRSNSREPSGLRREIERVVHFAGRMAFGEIQLGEVVVVGLDVRAFGDGKTHVGEDRGQFIRHLRDRMHAAQFRRRFAHRQRHVDGLGVEAGVERGVAERCFACRNRRGDAVLQPVDRAALASCARPASSRRASSAMRRSNRSCPAPQRVPLPARLRPWPRRRRPGVAPQVVRYQPLLFRRVREGSKPLHQAPITTANPAAISSQSCIQAPKIVTRSPNRRTPSMVRVMLPAM